MRRDRERLQDMLEAIRRIEKYAQRGCPGSFSTAGPHPGTSGLANQARNIDTRAVGLTLVAADVLDCRLRRETLASAPVAVGLHAPTC